jgi:AcrR family transcriptional regulator
MAVDHSPRKQPQQQRSREMYDRILQAAIRVLRDEGALGFTTSRVADEANISVGSLYQYFPNKHALVIALHEADMREGWEHMKSILDRSGCAGRQKLYDLAEWFFVTEADEAAHHGAVLGDIDVFLRHGSIDPELYAAALQRFVALIDDGSTIRRTEDDLIFAAQFVMTTLETLGKAVAARQLAPAATVAWAHRTAAMLSDHVGLQ